MNELELNWGVTTLVSLGICFFAFYGPQLVEYLGKHPDKMPDHRGKWAIAWVFSIPLLVENNFIQLAMSAVLIIVTYLVDKVCICIGYVLRKINWTWLPRVFFRPNLEMWDDLILGWSMCSCFNFALFLFLYSVSKLWGLDDSVGSFLFKWCQWLLYIGVVFLWLKWTLSRYYYQIEEWVDSIWQCE